MPNRSLALAKVKCSPPMTTSVPAGPHAHNKSGQTGWRWDRNHIKDNRGIDEVGCPINAAGGGLDVDIDDRVGEK
jgi:hypothetical protein